VRGWMAMSHYRHPPNMLDPAACAAGFSLREACRPFEVTFIAG